MQLKYSEIELKTALLTIPEDKLNEVVKNLIEKFSEASAPKDKAELNKVIAEFHGISVLDLINSPNYDRLTQEWGDSYYQRIIDIIMESGLNHKQASAILYNGMNAEMLGN